MLPLPTRINIDPKFLKTYLLNIQWFIPCCDATFYRYPKVASVCTTKKR